MVNVHFQELSSLTELFEVGQVVACARIDGSADNNVVPLSLNPRHIHHSLSRSHLVEGLVRL